MPNVKEIDMVVLNADERRIRLASCKRDAAKLPDPIGNLKQAAEVFLATHHQYAAWRVEWVGIAPSITVDVRATLAAKDVLAQGIDELTRDL